MSGVAPGRGILPKTAEVVIVGGGIIGLSIAYHLGQAGVRTLVLERGCVGEGSTARSSGGIRRLFSAEPAIRLAAESVRFWERFEHEHGASIDWHRVGYLLIARSASTRLLLESSWHAQQRLGVPSSLLQESDVRRLVPAMRTEDVLAGLYCPSDGYAGPYEALQTFRRGALSLGAEIVEACEVTGFRVQGDRIRGAETTQGTVDAPVVVNAAGVWAPRLARLVGIELPVSMYCRHQWIVQATEPGGSVPCTIDMDSTLFVRPEGAKYLIGIGGELATTSFDIRVDPDAFVRVAGLVMDRFPLLRAAKLVRTWAGLTQETPDRLPVLGPAGPTGHLLAAGFSHGFMQAPAAGKMIADYLTTGRAEVIPMDAFQFSRFDRSDSARSQIAAGQWEVH